MMPADPVAIARDLIRCQSVTPAEGGALAALEATLAGAGFTVERVTFSEPGFADVQNLYARIGSSPPHFVFAGHTDVVPPGDEAKWTHPPFGADIADGVLYGRGAVDMKGAVACAVAAALDYLADKAPEQKGSISFLITGDEEGVAVNGTVKLLQWAAACGEAFDHCILGEPTNPAALGDMIKDRPARLAQRHADRHRNAGARRLSAPCRQPHSPLDPNRRCAVVATAGSRQRAFRCVEPRIHLRRCRQPDR